MLDKFFETLDNLCHDGLDDEAWKFVADSVCDLLEGDLVQDVDDMLGLVDPFKYRDHADVLLAFLNSTVVVRDSLPRRDGLLRGVRREFVQLYGQELTDLLMVNL
jgi:hypothetical protein